MARSTLQILNVPLRALWFLVAGTSGQFNAGDSVELHVDADRQNRTRKNHARPICFITRSAMLGDHVKQRGSHVGPDRLRFDFSHFGPVTPAEQRDIERMVNAQVLHYVRLHRPAVERRGRRGVVAFFGDKYGDTVRMLTIADSIEACGGTHVDATGDIGLFKIVQETSSRRRCAAH